jgi:putative PIN family toxin of toxin-antitoxin system
MIKVVLDTNSLLVSIPQRSEFRPIFDALINGQIKLLVTTEILNEYAEVLERKMSPVVSFNVLELISQLENVEHVEVYYRWHLINRDVDDNKFVDCAVSGNARFIVTDDRHFRVLRDIPFPSVEVMRTEAFVQHLSELDR